MHGDMNIVQKVAFLDLKSCNSRRQHKESNVWRYLPRISNLSGNKKFDILYETLCTRNKMPYQKLVLQIL